MAIHITDTANKLLMDKGVHDKILLLITDDGGGKYSLNGGACSIGAKFTLIYLDNSDSLYPIKLQNEQDVDLYTSEYDLMFLGSGLTLDFNKYQLILRDDSGMLDTNVQLANGQDVLDSFNQEMTFMNKSC